MILRSISTILLFLFLFPVFTNGQFDSTEHSFGKKVVQYAYRFVNDSMDVAKPKFLLYPVLAYSPETNLEIGFSGLYLYYAKGKYEKNRLSEIQGFTFFTLNRQYGAWFDHFIYTDDDDWFFLGRLRFHRFPIWYYGVGPNTLKENQTVLNSDYTLIKERILRKVRKDFFIGVEVDYQRLYNVSFGRKVGTGYLAGADGTSNLGLGLGLVYDNRKNALNVRNGFFAEVGYLWYRPQWGSEYTFNSLISDFRIFRTVRPKQVLAWQLSAVGMGGQVPFNQLAQMGGESLMRGYYMGRFRDRTFAATQLEYRWLPFPGCKRLGGVLFAGFGTVGPTWEELLQQRILPTAGVGLRYLIFPRKDIFIRFDVGLTPEGPGFYIYTGEAF